MNQLETFFKELYIRITGPLGFRFILQPLVAILLGILDGIKDSRAGNTPFLEDFFIHPHKRMALLKSTSVVVIKPVIVGIVTDAIAQFLIFDTVHLLQAVVVGTLIIAIPYVLTRGIVNRIATRRKKTK
ncbi:MAG TPA: hypothetical protein VHO70_13085 [Chitinispirillaceae bacterium]|nr:hypothetical protein [Chitinispirillaceae bacterium]